MSRPQTLCPVHPHVCGEHVVLRHRRNPLNGSSPRVWGTLSLPIIGGLTPRFIPTCVGNIVTANYRRANTAVHPHVCGEHIDFLPSRVLSSGSSPRVWGTFASGVGSVRVAAGSSPRVWGTWGYKPFTPRRTRFIPTCVGNMRSADLRAVIEAVHPHVCGEHCIINRLINFQNGSSPRVWGT